MGAVTGARVLAEFGDAEGRYADAKSRKNYAGTSVHAADVILSSAPSIGGDGSTQPAALLEQL